MENCNLSISFLVTIIYLIGFLIFTHLIFNNIVKFAFRLSKNTLSSEIFPIPEPMNGTENQSIPNQNGASMYKFLSSIIVMLESN